MSRMSGNTGLTPLLGHRTSSVSLLCVTLWDGAEQSGLSNLPAPSCSLPAAGNVDLEVVQAVSTTFTSVESRG